MLLRPLLFLVAAWMCQQVSNAYAQPVRKPNVTSDRYTINQTFDGQAFFKDNNIWIYTLRFSEIFGMPPGNIDPDLKGVEAAAFRIEDKNYYTCGLGGKAENCKAEYRCITDIYIDEKKYPLPWATDQQADWLADHNSLRWLRSSPDAAIRPGVPLDVIPNAVVSGTFTLRPFADSGTRHEGNYFQNGDTPYTDDIRYNLVTIYGYKRQAIAGLTLVSLSYRCHSRNSQKPVVTFRLETREKIFSPPLKRFHEFQLPEMFGNKIDGQLQKRIIQDREYYRELLNRK